MRWSTPVAYVFQNIESLDGHSLRRPRAGDRRTSGPRFTTLHTFVKNMVAIALSSVAVARQSALTRKVQGTSS